MKHKRWRAAGCDETCDECKKPIEGLALYDRLSDKLLCSHCVDEADECLTGKLDSEDPRYSD